MHKKLNKQQEKIVLTNHKKVYVDAGPGTGKTYLIESRVCQLIDTGVLPSNILVVAFNKKIVEEVKRRLHKTLGYDVADKLTIKTFHGLGMWLLKRAKKKIKPIVETDKELSALLTKAKNGVIVDGKNVDLLPMINAFRENKTYLSNQKDEIKTLYKSYMKVLKTENVSDFSALIRKSNQLLKTNTEFKNLMQNKFKYIFIDEFQDSSESRFDLINLLTNEDTFLFLVGDADQTILEWTGVNIDNVLHLRHKFNDLKYYRLEQSYRLPKKICDASNLLISKNKKRLNKIVKPIKKSGILSVQRFFKFDDEVNWCQNYVKKVLKIGIKPKDIAILTRTERMYYAVREKLEGTGIHISTIHKAKGLEFKYVIIFGVEESIMPSGEDNIEEERRILYVGMTRAKISLTMTYISNGVRKIGFTNKYVKKSRFLKELNF